MTDNPYIAEGVYEQEDPLLSAEGLKYLGRQWAGDEKDLHNYRLSPMFGNLKELPPMIVIYGGYEVFCPDLRRFVQMAKDFGARIVAHEWPEMFHDFIIFRMPEADEAKKILFDELRNPDLF